MNTFVSYLFSVDWVFINTYFFVKFQKMQQEEHLQKIASMVCFALCVKWFIVYKL